MSDTPHLHVEFFTEATKNNRLSAEQGRPIFEDREFVRIKFVGDKHNELVAPAHQAGAQRDPMTHERLTYAQQFPRHYDAFKSNLSFRDAGSPLEALGLSPAKIAELNASHVYTIEGLAGLDGTLLQKLGMGARDLKAKAEQFLSKSADNALATKLEAENADLRARMEKLEKMLQQSVPATAQVIEPTYDTTTSPFAEWDADSIRLWLQEQGAPAPHHKLGKEKLVQAADEWNDHLAKSKAA